MRRQGARHCHALLFPAGEARGVALCKTGEVAGRNLFVDATAALGGPNMPQAEPDIFRHGKMREESVLLKHQPHVSRAARHVNAFRGVKQRLAVQHDAATHSGL